ncbi:hypothetical protein [Polyangium sorediatum]|uniref:STAS domain-containing protein n=1 Tax=Polyangium sorediatum TaxID=889274 RepID=A0ABT6P1B8_9BACT|nr:hypothetical protein [Polyangium sorediatum]MDI1434326.1 hypothetical protein [Polyangium sorediatum]
MEVLTFGMVMDGGRTVFTVVAARDDEDRLVLTFEGVLRVDNPYRYLWSFLEDLGRILPGRAFASIQMDFTQMPFINDNCMYTIMDIVDAVYLHVPGPVTVRRIANDEWQRVALPIFLNLSDVENAARTTFEDVEPPAR